MPNPRLAKHRQIGVSDNEANAYKKKQKNTPKKEESPIATKLMPEEKNKKIKDWLNISKGLFKINALCKRIGYDTANFNKILKSDEAKFSDELIAKIEPIIKEYGYSE